MAVRELNFCRVCDCYPCACGRQSYMSNADYDDQVRRSNEETEKDPMRPSAVPDGWGI